MSHSISPPPQTEVPHWLHSLVFRLSLAIIMLFGGIWGGFFLWYQLPVSLILKMVVIGLLGSACLTALGGLWHRTWKPVLIFALIMFVLLGWWVNLMPSHDRLWADDVSRLLHVNVDGNRIRLDNVRDFEWYSEADYKVRWKSMDFDLDHLVSADLVLSYWMGPAIAHTLISFGFDDGRYLTFSVEIRKEQGESFSALGGFFRQFEMVLIAATEDDIIRVRSNVRNEDVYLYRLQLSKPMLHSLFFAYLNEAQELEKTARFYNTISSNCTTIVFDLARAIDPLLPTDYRLLLSGYFAEYAYDRQGLSSGYDYATLHERGRITARARKAGDASGFSEAIRIDVPGIHSTHLQ